MKTRKWIYWVVKLISVSIFFVTCWISWAVLISAPELIDPDMTGNSQSVSVKPKTRTPQLEQIQMFSLTDEDGRDQLQKDRLSWWRLFLFVSGQSRLCCHPADDTGRYTLILKTMGITCQQTRSKYVGKSEICVHQLLVRCKRMKTHFNFFTAK